MILSAVVCPHPPLLLPEFLGPPGSRPAPVEELARACGGALRWLVAQSPDRIVVIGAGDLTRQYGTETSFFSGRFGAGTAGAPGPGLPLSLGIGTRLLDEAGWEGARILQALSADLTAEQCAKIGRTLVDEPGRVGLLVMGDGSARRGPKAPGYLDARAEDFDAEVIRALATGDPGALLALDQGLSDALMVQGRAAWQALAGATKTSAARIDAEVLYADDPYGVLYIVSLWQRAAGR